MAITDERYAEIDAELQRMRDYLAALATEIDTTDAHKYGATFSSAIHALGAITGLRHILASDLEPSIYFDDNEEGYLQWVKDHKIDGFIVNVGGGFPPKMHRANCKSVTTSEQTNYTRHEYKKDCSTSQSKLKATYAPNLTFCKQCFPSDS